MGAFGRRIGTVLRIVAACTAVQGLADCGLDSAFCRADTVTLSTGGLVRGRVLETAAFFSRRNGSPEEKQPGEKPIKVRTVTVATLTGGHLVLDSSQVRAVVRRPFLLEEYEARNHQTAEDVDSLWSLAEWCKNKGLKAQREEALRRILAIDPDHQQAHAGLGQYKHDGQWRTHDEEMRARGFVKFEGKYVAVQEVDILKKLHSRRKVESDWNDRVRSWSHALVGEDPEKRRRGLAQLLKITEPNALPALNKFLRPSTDEGSRELYVRILTHIHDDEAVACIVQQSLFDVSKSVRATAQEAITHENQGVARPLYARELRSPDNDVVRRCGMMLERVGDDGIVPNLIEALVTTHAVPAQVVDNSNTYSFGRGAGGFSTIGDTPLPPDVYGKLMTGQYPNGISINRPYGGGPNVKTVLVDREFRNAEVLSALQALTKQSFGYDKNQWRRWWAARTTNGVTKNSGNP